MEIRYRFSLLFEIVLALVTILGLVSQNESGLLIDTTKTVKSFETADNCSTRHVATQLTSKSGHNLVFLGFAPTAKGCCVLVPPPPNVTDDSNIPLQQRLADGVATMADKRLEMGVQDIGIFLLGNTGSGKSTVTQLLAGNLSRVHSSVTNGGEIVIFDEDDRIGPPTIRSKTLLPEYIIRNETGTVFIDCPGFDDNRGPDMDIAAMYFLKNALDSTSHSKFLFTTEYSALRAGNNRNSFDELIQHATTLIPNPNDKKSAIALIVTKVPRFDDFGRLRTRQQLLTSFKDFIEAYIDVQKEKLDNAMYNDEKEVIQRKIDICEIFLSDLGADQLPTRISYFRNPEDCGALGELPEMLETKDMLTDLYSNVISYIDVSPDDFNVTLKSETLLVIVSNHIPSTIDQIRNQTELGIRKLRLTFFDKFYTDMENKNDFYPTQIFSRAVEQLNFHMSDIQTNASDFGSHLFNLFTDLYMSPNDTYNITNGIQELENQLGFYEFVSGFSISRPNPSWLVPLDNMAIDLGEYLQFYDFCEKLELELRTHSKQLILGWLRSKGVEMKFQTDEVIGFLSNNSITSVPSKIQDLFHSKMIDKDKQYLADLVRIQLPNVTLECESLNSEQSSYRLIAAGRYVRLGDVVHFTDSLPPALPWPGQCSDHSKVQQIRILAEDLLYLDDALSYLCEQKHISIIAQEWEVVGTSKITLGCHVNKPTCETDAISGRLPGESGNAGFHGRDGIDSGTFLGILSKIANGNNLVINTDGDYGGCGQNGGSGVNGDNGIHAGRGDFPSAMKCAWESKCSPAWEHSLFWFRVSGWKSGQAGGNGGNGGNGGKPGRAGTLELVTGELSVAANVSSKPGSPGRGGIGGYSGKGGFHGGDYTCRLGSITAIDWWWHRCYFTDYGYARDGTPTTNGANPDARTDKIPLPATQIELINEYQRRFNKNFYLA